MTSQPFDPKAFLDALRARDASNLKERLIQRVEHLVEANELSPERAKEIRFYIGDAPS